MEASNYFGRNSEEGFPTPSSTSYDDPLSSSSSSAQEWNSVVLKRRKVEQALNIYWNLFNKLFCEYKADQLNHLKAKTKALREAVMLMKKKHQWENTQKRVGHILGIEVGDRFQNRPELIVIGLHHQFTSGIDYLGRGRDSLATCIVVTSRYDNVRKSSDSLIYIGQGGNPNATYNVVPHDQKLEGGNLALKNSMDAKSPVRVILQVCRKSDRMDDIRSNYSSNSCYVYDGLYLVEKMTQERGKFGKLVFKYTMNRIVEQPRTCVSPKDVFIVNERNSGHYARFTQRKRHKSKAQKDVVCVNDISNGQEKFPIRVVIPMDSDQMLPSFDYIVKIIYSKRLKLPMVCSCDCVDGCMDFDKCACIVKNGGTMPYHQNKRLTSEMKLSPCIYECGPSCKCSSTCINRVSQSGIQFQLEIFKTELKGWGVRTRSFIPSGSFVCEYIGEVYHYREAGSRLDDDSYIFHQVVRNGFIDATRRGNIARFINHSCSPNLDVKDVIYDHDDKSFPHKVMFALKDIPAGRELSYNYNCHKGRISKVKNNSCHCGSPECNAHIFT